MKKLKKLRLSEVQDYAVISPQEQMTMKGGNPLPPGWWTIVAEVAGWFGGGGGQTNTSFQVGGTNQNVTVYGSGDVYIIQGDNGVQYQVISADSLRTADGTMIYNPQFQ